MDLKSRISSNPGQTDQPQAGSSPAQAVTPPAVPAPHKKTVTGFTKVWIIFWIVGNLAAACAPANRLTDSNLGGLTALVMLLSAVIAAGYILLYYKKPVGLYMILIANLLGVFMNFIQVTGYSLSVTTGLIIGIITYFITRKQVPYPFWKPKGTN